MRTAHLYQAGLTLVTCLIPAALLAQVNLQPGEAGDAFITEYATQPLSQYYPVILTVVYSVCAFTGLMSGFKIYARWQLGDPGVTREISLWVGSFILLLVLTVLLNGFFNQQDFGHTGGFKDDLSPP